MFFFYFYSVLVIISGIDSSSGLSQWTEDSRVEDIPLIIRGPDILNVHEKNLTLEKILREGEKIREPH